MGLDHTPVFPETRRIVVTGRHEVAAQFNTKQVQHTGYRRRTTTMHPQHQDRCGGARRRGYGPVVRHGRIDLWNQFGLVGVPSCCSTGTDGSMWILGTVVDWGRSSSSKRWLMDRVSSSAWVSVSMM